MNRVELKKKLEELGLSPSYYSFDGERKPASYVLTHSLNEWRVFLMDEHTDKRHDERIFNSEEEACNYMYEILKRMDDFLKNRKVAPIDRILLKRILDALKIKPSYYSLDGSFQPNCIILSNSNEKWIVFYMDGKGGRHNEKIFYTEDEACRYIWEYLKKPSDN